MNALLGLIFIGLPCIRYTLVGRFGSNDEIDSGLTNNEPSRSAAVRRAWSERPHDDGLPVIYAANEEIVVCADQGMAADCLLKRRRNWTGKVKSVILGLLMWQTAEPIVVGKQDREFMEELVCSGNTPQKVIFRIAIVLGAAEGKSNGQLVRDLGTTKSSVLKWRARYWERGLDGILDDAPRSGRKKTISAEKEASLVQAMRMYAKDLR